MSNPQPGLAGPSAVQGLAAASAALVAPHDVIGTVTKLLLALTEATGAAGAGLILRRPGQDHLDLLAATSHRAEELELYQAQVEQGPCFEAIVTGAPFSATTLVPIGQRWPGVAEAFLRAGYRSVQATPLRWDGIAIGALNVFWAEPGGYPVTHQELAQAFADLATLTIIHAPTVPVSQVVHRTLAALDERTIVEQAKGVLAQDRRIPMDAAFTALLELAHRNQQLLTATAAEVIERATTR